MGKPHVHAELIKAWADGAEIECKSSGESWWEIFCPSWDAKLQYRIKPEREYPKTTLTAEQLYKIYENGPGMVGECCIKIANAAIKQHIIDEEAKNG